MAGTTRLAINTRITLDINGSTQLIRLCAERAGLPPLLIVQAGPGIPLLNEVSKFQRRLKLEHDFLVGYWEQRGCGAADRKDAESVSLAQQVDDLCAVVKWLHQQTGQRVILLGISLGGTYALEAAGRERDRCRAIVAVSPDSHTALSDAAAADFLHQQSVSAGDSRLSGRVKRLEKPPYLDPAALQRRARLLADLGSLEQGKTFNALLREGLFSMITTYGMVGAVKALRNMNVVQGKILPEVASLDLFAHPPHVTVPVHYVFGERDALTPASVVTKLPAAVAAPESTVTVIPNAAHMAHFDHPDVVRSVALNVGA